MDKPRVKLQGCGTTSARREIRRSQVSQHDCRASRTATRSSEGTLGTPGRGDKGKAEGAASTKHLGGGRPTPTPHPPRPFPPCPPPPRPFTLRARRSFTCVLSCPSHVWLFGPWLNISCGKRRGPYGLPTPRSPVEAFPGALGAGDRVMRGPRTPIDGLLQRGLAGTNLGHLARQGVHQRQVAIERR